MFSAQTSPIAIDFGSSAVKMLQTDNADPPGIVAAIGLRVPDELRVDKDVRLGFLERQLARMLRKGRFRGKRVVCSVPAGETFVQHMQVAHIPGTDPNEREDLIKTQLQAQLGWPPYGMVIRTFEVCTLHRDGENLQEVICVAMSRDTVMRYVGILRTCKMEVVGVHSEVQALQHAFTGLDEDESKTTMYVDIGWNGTNVAIVHDGKLTFARTIQVGGHHIDERLAKQLGCDEASARAHRISEQVLASAAPPKRQKAAVGAAAGAPGADAGAGNGGGGAVNLVADSLAEELSMCLRYHQSLFRDRKVERVIFSGGEARDIGLCQHIAKALRLPAQLGDPLSQLQYKRSLRTPGLALGQPQPGWAVACGLCSAPTDL
jgi:type IV pilus assembly protein PilM